MFSELIAGGIDLHTHSYPSIYARSLDDFELAREVKDAGMRGVVLKAHECSTVGRAFLVEKNIPEIKVFGGVVLNWFVGGLNLQAVEACLRMGGKIVWFPTLHAQNHIEYFRQNENQVIELNEPGLPLEGISVLDPKGCILPEIEGILKAIKKFNAILATGHLSREEIFALVDAALVIGVEKVLITHADLPLHRLTIADQEKLASRGCFLEKCCYTIFEPFSVPVGELAKSIRTIGSQQCVLVSDLGVKNKPRPVEGMQNFIKDLLEEGIKLEEIRTMLVENPAKLLWS
ncbi:DUF6282 family protein [Desulfofundulus thermocisternus]|uniref:DUF6282 family protein n=1 Tax=Desulfofundulus thermocisternus TaxID=42471 RepID=UPI00217DB6DF|nr:DUF6282 family protein [Desulfofundulus thermocisternus]MCS5694716.1 DUF6282 family protein [Desulfofundulus thermocisternus]